MQYTTLGSSGLIVSKLGFGVMTFGSAERGIKGVAKAGGTTANTMVAAALDAGVTFFDTADAYSEGESEVMLGKALGVHRRDVVVSTKIGFRVSDPALVHAGLSYRRIIEATEDSLRRLGTDYIDVLSLHNPDPFTPLDETVRGLEDVVRRGWVRYVGYSNYPTWQAATMLERQRARGFAPMVAAQMYYSLLGRDLEIEHVPFAQANGIGTVVWSPLASGFLTGKYTRDNPTGNGGRLNDFDFIPLDKERAYDAIERLRELATARGTTIAQLALAWLLHRPAVDVVLIGASTPAQFTENAKAATLELTPDEQMILDGLAPPARPYPAWFSDRIGPDQLVAAAVGHVDHS
jgi:aryl-alcohol dehydrogenase-like predicted oxidoreductase